jgi:methylenetetrahydrofolate reductase (NADPH)
MLKRDRLGLDLNVGKQNLAQVQQELSVIQPDYFSVTFGAGGTTQDATLETILNIQNLLNLC